MSAPGVQLAAGVRGRIKILATRTGVSFDAVLRAVIEQGLDTAEDPTLSDDELREWCSSSAGEAK